MTKAHGEMSAEEGSDVEVGKMSRRKQLKPQHIAKSCEDVNLDEICADSHLPSELLQVKVTHDDPLTLGVFSRLALPGTSNFGPFTVTRVSDTESLGNAAAKSSTTLKFTEDVTVRVESDSGAWLNLLQTTTEKALANTKLILAEDESAVRCELCSDLPADTQLVTMLIRDTPLEGHDLGDSPLLESPASFSPEQGLPLEFPHNHLPAFIYPCYDKGSLGEWLGKTCPFPGQQPWTEHCLQYRGDRLGKSNHYYDKKKLDQSRVSQTSNPVMNRCRGKRGTAEGEEAPRKLFKSDDGPVSLDFKVKSPQPSSPTHQGSASPTSVTSGCGSPKRELTPPITGAFKCQTCSYTADKKSRLIEHMLSHSEDLDDNCSITTSPGGNKATVEIEAISSPDNSVEKICNDDVDPKDDPTLSKVSQKASQAENIGYDIEEQDMEEVASNPDEWHCTECDISFSSHGTFQAHKNFYCGSRATRVSHTRRASEGYRKASAAPSGVRLQQGYTLLPTMMCPGMIVPTPVMGMPPFMTTYAAVPYIVPVAPPPTQPPIAHSGSKNGKKRHQEQPLDLSCKKDDDDSEDESIEDQNVPNSSPNYNPATLKLQIKSPITVENGGLPQTPPRKFSRAVLPQQMTPPVMMAAGPSVFRCEDCNIVFYKRDNYTVHKEHYCAGRRAAKVDVPSPTSPPHSPASSRSLPTSPDSKKSPSKSTASPASSTRDSTTPDEYTVQYFCIPCKIKFSSPDTLEAHQQYYCPARKVIAEQLAAQASINCASLSPKSCNNEKAVCPQCQTNFVSVDEMMKHACNNTRATMKIPMFCCPYCEYVAQSDSRLLDHIKAHAPTKAYRCTLCGYRGNTVRGMRMHGKTHIDAGETFTDDHMCELEEPPLIPKRLRTVTESVAINVATEMIRQNAAGPLQHHRQRSKSIGCAMEEKGRGKKSMPTRHICEECQTIFSDTTALQTHMQLHLQEKIVFKCKACNYVTNSKGELVRHVKTTHENGKVFHADTTKQSDFKNSARYTIENLISVKQETTPISTSAAPVLERNNNFSPVMKKCISAPAVMETSPVKSEHQSSAPPSPVVISPKPSGSQQEVVAVTLGQVGERLIGLNADKCNYCSQCDISFVYRNTYLAHKKYYCSSHIGERLNVAPAEV